MQATVLPTGDKSTKMTMTRKEAADYLDVSLRTIDRMCKEGTLRWRKVRHGVRILRSSVEIKEAS